MTPLNAIKVILLVVIALVLAHITSRWKRGEIGGLQFSIWIAVWAAGAFFVVWPDSSTQIANKLGVGRGADLVTYVSIVTLFYVVFRLLVKVEGLRRDITELTRLLAIEVRRREEESARGTTGGGA